MDVESNSPTSSCSPVICQTLLFEAKALTCPTALVVSLAPPQEVAKVPEEKSLPAPPQN